jgi:hypothetical protein
MPLQLLLRKQTSRCRQQDHPIQLLRLNLPLPASRSQPAQSQLAILPQRKI